MVARFLCEDVLLRFRGRFFCGWNLSANRQQFIQARCPITRSKARLYHRNVHHRVRGVLFTIFRVCVGRAVVEEVFRRLPFYRLIVVWLLVIVVRRLVGGKWVKQFNLGSGRSLLVFAPNASYCLNRRLRDALVTPRVQRIRRHVHVRGPRRASVVGIRSFKRRLHAGRSIHLTLFGVHSGFLMYNANADNVRVRPNSFHLKGCRFCVVFCALYARATVRRFRSTTHQTKAKGLVNVSTMVTDRLIRPLVVHRARVAILTFEGPTTNVAFCRQDRATAILGRSGLLLALRYLFCLLSRHQ